MKILYWILCALLNAGSIWCLWTGLRAGADGKDFLAVPFGAVMAAFPFFGLLVAAAICRYWIGLAGLAAPAALIAWGAAVMAGK